MGECPLVSVLMPVYNGEKYVSLAIESILSQTFQDFEFIIVNDASTDSTKDIISAYAIKDPRIVIITNESNLNIAGSLNKGIESAKGDFIARMDADDIALKDRLEKQSKLLVENPKVAVVGSDIQVIDESGNFLGYRKYPTDSRALKKVIFRYSPFAHPAVMFRKKVVQDAGGYDKTKSPSEDVDLWFRLGVLYDFMSIPQVLLKYRVFLNSSSNKKLRRVEWLTLSMRYNAIVKLKYKIGFFDLVYNILQAMTIYLMPISFRVRLFNFIRNHNFI